MEEGLRGTVDIVKIDDQEVSLEAVLFALQRNVIVNPPGLNVEFRGLFQNELNLTEEVALAFPWLQKLSFKVKTAGNLLATVSPPLDIEFSNAGGNVSVDVSGDLSTQQATEPFTLLVSRAPAV